MFHIFYSFAILIAKDTLLHNNKQNIVSIIGNNFFRVTCGVSELEMRDISLNDAVKNTE